MGRTARVALRVNPDVDAGTHAKITTGRAQDKFGIPYADAVPLYRRAAALPGIQPVGLATHIGSQILSLAPYRAAYGRLAELVRTLRADGLPVSVIDCGGGLGIPYRDEPAPLPAALAGAIRGALHNLDVRIVVEPGRWLVGPAGVLLASVILAKQTQGSRFVVLDAAMNDLVRPAMYDAWHGIVPVSAVDAVAPVAPADVVGPVCETGDTFARNRMLPPLAAGARVAILDAGAYGSVMSSAYNARPVAAEVMVDGSDWSVIRERQTHADLWRGETHATLAEMNAPGGESRSPAAPACRPPRAGPLRHPVRAHLAGAVAAARRCRPVRLRRPARPAAPAAAVVAYRRCSRSTGLLILGLLVRGLRGIAAPDDKAADRRLELASGPVAPAAGGADRPASRGTADPTPRRSRCGRRMSRARCAQVRRLRIGLPRPGLARRDPRALRAALVVALVAAFAIAGDDAPSRLAQAMEPTLPREIPPPATELQAWITPPAYTRLAPIFLKPDGGTVSVPAGAHLTVSVTGGSGAPTLSLDGHAEPFRALDKASFQADRDLTAGGHLTVRRDGRELAAWDLTVVADQPPTAEWSDNPARAPGSQQTRLPWRAVGRLWRGLAAGRAAAARPARCAAAGGEPAAAGRHAEIGAWRQPAGPDGASLGRAAGDRQAGGARRAGPDRRERRGRVRPAGAAVPEPGGAGADGDPARPQPASGRPRSAVNGLDALLMAPEALGGDYGAYMNLGAIYYLLERNKAPDAVGEAQQRMWELALHLEEGQTERTARALDEARQAARDALDKAIREPNEANREALDRKLKELEEAIERHLQALAEEARRNNDEMPFDPDAQHLSNRDLDKMAEQAREAAREGRMEDAQQRMAELERMLDKLRNARAEHGRDGERTEAQRQRGRQQMGAVQDMIGRQGGAARPLAGPGRRDDAVPRQPAADPAGGRGGAARGGPAGAAGAAARAGRADAAVRRPDRPGAAQPGRGRQGDARGRAAVGRGQRRRRRRVGAEGDRGAAEGRPRDGPGDGQAVRSAGRPGRQRAGRRRRRPDGADAARRPGRRPGPRLALRAAAGPRAAGPRSAGAPLRAGQLGRRRERRRDGAGGTRAAAHAGDPGGAAPPRRRTRCGRRWSWTTSTGC